MPRILVSDDHTIFRAGLRSLVGAKIPGAEVLEANSLIQALSQIRTCAFDLVLVGVDDISNFAPLDPVKAASQESSSTRFAVISASDTRADIIATLAAGFHGFISKHQSDREILAGITDLLSGRIYVPPSLAEVDREPLDARYFSGAALPVLSTEANVLKLTKRQREVLALLARGKSNKEIARDLNIAEATTKIHMAALLRVLGVRNRTEAAYKSANLLASRELGQDGDRSGVASPFAGLSPIAV